MSERMRFPTAVLGIDIAKEQFDVALWWLDRSGKPQHRRFATAAAGYRDLLAWLHQQQVPSDLPACMEATGDYWRELATVLYKHGYLVSVVNPARIKFYRQSELLRIKTDKSDAALIARFCLAQSPRLWVPMDEQQLQMRELSRAISTLEKQERQLKTRLSSKKTSLVVRTALLSVITDLQEQIKVLEQEMKQFLKQHPDLGQQVKLLSTIKGIGRKTAIIFVAELGDFSQFASASALVANLGLSPHQRQSGRKQSGVSPICKIGDARLRAALYFPTMSAFRYNPQVAALYERLVAKGKPKMVAMCAAMHKLTRQMFAVMHTGQAYDPAHQGVLVQA